MKQPEQPTPGELAAFMQGYRQREKEVQQAIRTARVSRKDTAAAINKSWAAGNWMLRIEAAERRGS